MKHWTFYAAADSQHPNRLPFKGVLTTVDVTSDKAPSGARGHKVVLTKKAAESALHTLIGMAVDYKDGWDGHNVRQKIGVITDASMDGHRVMVEGYLYAKDFPDIILQLESASGKMGMSYALDDAQITDMRATIWEINKATFTGAAIMYKDKAAYKSTSFEVSRDGFTLCGTRDTELVCTPVAACT